MQWKIVFRLYLSFFKISGFTLGGGMVMLPLMEAEFVEKRKLITHNQMLEVYAAVQSLPGVIAINSSLLIGFRVGGLLGALVSVLGVLTPSVVIITALAEGIQRISQIIWVEYAFTGVRAGVAAIMLFMLLRLVKKTLTGWKEILLASLSFLAVEVGGIHPILVILGAALMGGLLFRDDRVHTEPGDREAA